MLDTIRHGEVLELRMNRPPVNALGPELVARLLEAVRGAPREGAQALVLSGSSRIFSAGLDVPALLKFERPELYAFLTEFFSLTEALGRSSIPVIAAITGHAPAGGAVLSVCCDYRVMAEGSFRVGVNEVEVGLMAPTHIFRALVHIVGGAAAERLVTEGKMLDAAEALRVGLVNELAPSDQVVPRALAHAERMLALPREAMLNMRAVARAELHSAFAQAQLDTHTVGDFFYRESAQTTLKALVAKLASKK